VRFTDAWRAEEDDILSPLDEAELVQAFDRFTTQRGLEREVEVAELCDHRQPAGSHRGLQAPVIPQLNLRREQLLDGLGTVSEPPSTPWRIVSRASSARGIRRSARICRRRSRRDGAALFMRHLPRDARRRPRSASRPSRRGAATALLAST